VEKIQKKIPIELFHREIIESSWKKSNQSSFYHYFPLVYAISKSTEPLNFGQSYGDIFLDDIREIYIGGRDLEDALISDDIKKIWVVTRPPEIPQINYEVYDVNYILDLNETIGVKYFRKNAQRYSKDGRAQYSPEGSPEIAKEIVMNWYQKSFREEFTDFGYTMWLAENYEMFPDLKARFLYLNDKPVAFSLWGELSSKMAIHLICKDSVAQDYLQDYARMMTYKEMVGDGFETVNDGSDCGEPGIRHFKLKLRPKYIVPIYSWVRKK